MNQDTTHISGIEVDKHKDEMMDENGFIFIVDDDEEMDTTTPNNAKKRKVEMEEGELP